MENRPGGTRVKLGDLFVVMVKVKDAETLIAVVEMERRGYTCFTM